MYGNWDQTNLHKYLGKMVIMTMTISQIPIILSDIVNYIPKIIVYLCTGTVTIIRNLFKKTEIKYKYSKTYNQEVLYRTFTNALSTKAERLHDDISSNLLDLLAYICDIDF